MTCRLTPADRVRFGLCSDAPGQVGIAAIEVVGMSALIMAMTSRVLDVEGASWQCMHAARMGT